MAASIFVSGYGLFTLSLSLRHILNTTNSNTFFVGLADVAVEPKPVEPKAYSTEDYMRITEEQAKALVPEEQRKGICTSTFAKIVSVMIMN